MAQINMAVFVNVCVLFFLQCHVSATPHTEFGNTVEIPVNNYQLYQQGILPGNVICETTVESFLLTTFKQHRIDVNKVNLRVVVRVVQQKLKNMVFKMRKIKGSHSKNKTIENWKASDYMVKVHYKTDSPIKRKLKEDIQNERKKRKKSADKVKKTKQKVELLTKQKRSLERQIERLLHPTTKAKRGKGINKTAYSKSFKRKMNQRRIMTVKKSIKELFRGQFTPLTLIVRDIAGQNVSIEIDDRASVSRVEYLKQLIDKLIYVLDTQSISRRAYHELTMLCPSLPRQYRLNIRKQELNSQFHIHELDDYVGVWQSFTETMSNRLAQLMTEPSSREHILDNGSVKVKVTGDGTTIGKRIHVVNIAFSIIGEATCVSTDGSYLLAIVRASEKQASLADALKELIREINELDTVLAAGEHIKVQLFLGGDLKFLNQMMGIEGFSSKHSCLWCHCPSELRWDFQKVWCMNDVHLGARTVASITEKSSKKGREKLNCFSTPLFSNIPVINVIPDTLHLFLRVADQLINHLIVELKSRDNMRKCAPRFAITKYSNMQQFEKFVQSLGISWQFYADKTSGLITSRDFTGPEHRKIFNNINLQDIIPDHPKLDNIVKLWSGFLTLMHDMKGDLAIAKINQFEKNARAWVELFTKVYLCKDVTPYMHVLMNHVPDSLRLHGNISNFSQQGLEKLNDYVTAWYFRSTSHIKNQAFRQVMQKQNRINLLTLPCRRINTSVTCTVCHKLGHNKRTCQVVK